MTSTFTDEEAKVYDRQIRLWGMQAQQKIRSTDVLVIGLAGLATEVVKNLVLTGINSITLMDDKAVTNFDMMSNLFTRNQVGMNRALAVQKAVQELNPMVTVNVKDTSVTSILADKASAELFIKQFNVVVLVNHNAQSTVELNKLCRECQVAFFAACAWGFFSLTFCDLGKDFNGIDFVQFSDVLSNKSVIPNPNDRSKRKAKSSQYKGHNAERVFLVFLTLYKYHDKYGQFPEILNEESREKLVENLKTLEAEVMHELNLNRGENSLSKVEAPEEWHSKILGQFTFTSSIVGGFLAQDLIRSVTNDTVENNCFIFDGLRGYNLNIGY